MSTPRFGAGLAVSIVFVLVGVTLARPAAAQGMYLKEIAKDGRNYVFNNAANAERFEKTGEMGAAITMLKAGPSGETVIGDSERALQLYFFRHGLPVVVPDPPPQPPPAPPWKISGLVFGDYYYFPQQHLPALEDQHGMWIRRAYFTYDHTFTPAVTTRLRVEFNSNGKLQGGLITPYLKDAYVKWTFWKRQQVTVGYHPSLTFDFLDGLWGLRHVEKTPVDLYRMDSSRDTGFMLSGPLNESQSLRYAVQFGNESGTNAETDRFKGYRAVARYEKNPGLVVEGMVGYFNRANDADRTTAQIIAGWRQPRGRVAFQYTFQRREAAPGPFTDLNVYSGFGVYDVKPQKFSVFARVDRMNNPCLDCPGMDYLPIDAVAPFTLTIVGVEYFVLPSVRFSPNVEYVAYSEPAVGAKPKNDVAARLTFYWVW